MGRKFLRGFALVWLILAAMMMAVGYAWIFWTEGWWAMMAVMPSPFNITSFIVTVISISPALGAWWLADYLGRRKTKENHRMSTDHRILERAEALVHAYSRVLQAASGVAVDEGRLPASKDDIKAAIRLWLSVEQDPQTIDLLRTVYLRLAMFQPGVGDAQLSINSFLKCRHLNAEDLLERSAEDALELAKAMRPHTQEMLRWMPIVAQEERQLMADLDECSGIRASRNLQIPPATMGNNPHGP